MAGGHLFLKLFHLASQKWLPKSQIGWEHLPTVPIFLEPWVGRSLSEESLRMQGTPEPKHGIFHKLYTDRSFGLGIFSKILRFPTIPLIGPKNVLKKEHNRKTSSEFTMKQHQFRAKFYDRTIQFYTANICGSATYSMSASGIRFLKIGRLKHQLSFPAEPLYSLTG